MAVRRGGTSATAARSRADHRSDALLLVDADADPFAFAELYERHAGSGGITYTHRELLDRVLVLQMGA